MFQWLTNAIDEAARKSEQRLKVLLAGFIDSSARAGATQAIADASAKSDELRSAEQTTIDDIKDLLDRGMAALLDGDKEALGSIQRSLSSLDSKLPAEDKVLAAVAQRETGVLVRLTNIENALRQLGESSEAIRESVAKQERTKRDNAVMAASEAALNIPADQILAKLPKRKAKR
jgi:hypothetical protein